MIKLKSIYEYEEHVYIDSLDSIQAMVRIHRTPENGHTAATPLHTMLIIANQPNLNLRVKETPKQIMESKDVKF